MKRQSYIIDQSGVVHRVHENETQYEVAKELKEN